MTLVYSKTNDCSVCEAVRPRVEKLTDKYHVDSILVNISEVPEFSGQMSVFTVPTIMVYLDGKEVHRQSRIIRFDELEAVLEKWLIVYEVNDYGTSGSGRTKDSVCVNMGSVLKKSVINKSR